MAANDRELEVKFYLADLPGLEARLQAAGASLSQPSVHETNLRFDTRDGALGRGYQVLRLRQDNEARLTYKGPGQLQGGARLRQEIEFTVGDFAAARRFLEALGFQVVLMYEKRRAAYRLGQVEVTLDEMPFGDFAEIEGLDSQDIREAAHNLGLDWEQRIVGSYTDLFEQARRALGFTFRDLSFENFASLQVHPEQWGVQPADVN